MSEEYEDDFENCYEEDFESDEGDLEVPELKQQQHAETDYVEEPVSAGSAAASQLNTRIWPSLSTSLHSPQGKGRKQGIASPALFGKSLFAVEPGRTSLSSSSTGGASTSADVLITLQPPLPPLTDTQRKQAAAVLHRSKQLQQQVKLHASTQLDLLVLHPLSLYQQYSQGVGVYAGRAAAACQTRQLDQDIREQDVQTDQIEQQPGACQVPEDLYSSTRTQHQQQPGTQQAHNSLPMDLLAASNSAFAEFIDWAVPQVLFELGRAQAEAAAESTLISAAAGPSFAAVQTAAHALGGSSSGTVGAQALLAGELQLLGSSLLAGRPLVGITGPPTPQAAAAAAAAIAAASSVAAAVAAASSHVLLACYGPVAMSAAAAVSEHGLAGLGCLCVWDLQVASSQAQVSEAAAEGSSMPHGVLQLLVSEGKPTCCCWGAGEAATLVFAGTEEGGICCWDLAEPDKAHRVLQTATAPQQQSTMQQQQSGANLPSRRPSYSGGLPLFAGASSSSSSGGALATGSSSGQDTVLTGMVCDGALAAGGVVGLAAVPSTSSSSGSYGGAAGAGGGAVCRLVVLSAGGCVTLYSVMLGETGSDVAVADLGMRSGSRVWLVKVCEGLPLGLEVVKPPHMKRAAALAAVTARDAGTKAAPDSSSTHNSSRQHCQTHSGSCLLVLPGATQQLLVGTDGGRVLKGAALGVTQPPHEYTSVQWWPGSQYAAVSDTDAVPDGSGSSNSARVKISSGSSSSLCGAVTSLSVCPLLPDVWVAGHSCGRLALFSQKCSRPGWVWQHPTGAAVVAVRWLPQSCGLVAAFSSSGSSSTAGSLVAFQLSTSAKQPCAVVNLQAPTLSSTVAAQAGGGQQALAPQPCCMEVLSMSGANSTVMTSYNTSSESTSSDRSLRQQPSSSSKSRGVTGQAVRAAVAVGFTDGSCSLYQLAAGWSGQSGKGDLEALQALTSC